MKYVTRGRPVDRSSNAVDTLNADQSRIPMPSRGVTSVVRTECYYVTCTDPLYVSRVVPLMRMCVRDVISFCEEDKDSIPVCKH